MTEFNHGALKYLCSALDWGMVLCTFGPSVSASNGPDCSMLCVISIIQPSRQSWPLIAETDGPHVHGTIPISLRLASQLDMFSLPWQQINWSNSFLQSNIQALRRTWIRPSFPTGLKELKWLISLSVQLHVKDEKINFSVTVCVFIYQKSFRTHNFNFSTGKCFPAK